MTGKDVVIGGLGITGLIAGAAALAKQASAKEITPQLIVTFPHGTWANMPAALAEFWSGRRTLVDTSSFTQARLVANVVTLGASAAELRVQYYDGVSKTWKYLDGVSGPRIVIGTSGVKASGYGLLAAGARGDNQLRLVGINGDGVLDPGFGIISVQFR